MKTSPAPSCPKCGAKMILRRPKEGQTYRPFWGCGDFPNCDGRLTTAEWDSQGESQWWENDKERGRGKQ